MRGHSARIHQQREGDPHASWGVLVLLIDRATPMPRPLLAGLDARRVDIRLAHTAIETVAACASPRVRGVIVVEPSVLDRIDELRHVMTTHRPDLVCWRYTVNHLSATMLEPFGADVTDDRSPVTLDSALAMTDRHAPPRTSASSPERRNDAVRRDTHTPVRTGRDRLPPAAHADHGGTYLSPDELDMLLGDADDAADAPLSGRGARP